MSLRCVLTAGLLAALPHFAGAVELSLASPLPEQAYPSLATALAILKKELATGEIDVLVYRSEEDMEPPLLMNAGASLPLLKALQESRETFSAQGIPLEFRWHIAFRQRSNGPFLDLVLVYSRSTGRCTLADLVIIEGVLFRGKSYISGPASMAKEAEGVFQEYQLALPSDPKALIPVMVRQTLSPAKS